MLKKLQKIFQHGCWLDSTRISVIGVSGGPDSVCLLDALHRSGYSLVVAHLNHKLRPESANDALYVEGLSRQFGLEFTCKEVDVRSYAAAHSLSIEEAAREVRYQFLFTEASRRNAQAVLVAHTADDQVETILMHWLRGAGMEGLRGMPYRQLPNAWSEAIPLVRPLLGISRKEILAYCQENDLHPVTDASNLDQTYFRNRLRHELLPYLRTYNRGIDAHILNLANILQYEEPLLVELVNQTWQRIASFRGPGFVGFRRPDLQGLPLGMQRRLIRKAIALIKPGLRDITFQVVERAVNFLAGGNPERQVDLAAGIRIFNEAEFTWLAEGGAQLPVLGWLVSPAEALQLERGKTCEIRAAGWRLSLHETSDFRPQFQAFQQNPDAYQAWLDADRLVFPLTVRRRLPGDRIQPLGMAHGSVKVSDYMMNVKLPRRARADYPLVCSQEDVVWIPGYTIHHAYRITDQTRRAAHLVVNREVE